MLCSEWCPAPYPGGVLKQQEMKIDRMAGQLQLLPPLHFEIEAEPGFEQDLVENQVKCNKTTLIITTICKECAGGVEIKNLLFLCAEIFLHFRQCNKIAKSFSDSQPRKKMFLWDGKMLEMALR